MLPSTRWTVFVIFRQLSSVSQKLLASLLLSQFEGAHRGNAGRLLSLLLLSEQIRDGTRPDQDGGNDEN
jgi:hypothetical protein